MKGFYSSGLSKLPKFLPLIKDKQSRGTDPACLWGIILWSSLMTEIKRHNCFPLGEALQQRAPWFTMKCCLYYFTLSLTRSLSKLTLFKLIGISLHLISLLAELFKTNSPFALPNYLFHSSLLEPSSSSPVSSIHVLSCDAYRVKGHISF